MGKPSSFPVAVFLFVLAFLVTGCKSSSPETLAVGHLAPRGAAERTAVKSADEGVTLAVEDVKDDPPLAGRQLVVRNPDNLSSDDALLAAATRLCTVDRVTGLLVDVRATTAEQVCRTAQPHSIPVVTSASLPGSALGSAGFSVAVAPAEQGKYLARFCVEKLKDQLKSKTLNVALLADSRQLFSQPFVAAFTEELGKDKEAKLKVWSFDQPSQFNEQLKDVKNGDFTVVAVAAREEELAKVCGDDGRGADVPVLFGGDEEGAAGQKSGGPTVYRASAYFADGSAPRAQEFEKKYEKRFQNRPDAAAALAYDAARVLFHGIREAKSAQGAKVREELVKVKDFESLTGPLSFDKDHNPRRPVFVVHRDAKGQRQLDKRYEPE